MVAPQTAAQGGGSWLIVGDAKDYERVRSRIDDGRMLKGFLQVALGAEAFAAWSERPAGMAVHDHGVLAVPRNAFLQPTAVVEDLHDHRLEVRMRVAERAAAARELRLEPADNALTFVRHLAATFDPSTCTTCNMFVLCRDELRQSTVPADLLVELGVDPDLRPHVLGLVDGTGVIGSAPESVVAGIRASVDGHAVHTGQRRTDPAGEPGTINVVIAKADAAALGIHGMSVQRVSAAGVGEWHTEVYDAPQAPETRQKAMRLLGSAIEDAMRAQRKATPEAPSPIHLVVPDGQTGDVLTSMADNLAGVELSRLRWERDLAQGRPALTWDGEPAVLPKPLRETARTAVSFLLEEDRARALQVRMPIVDLRAVFSRHFVAGGPAVNALRLDYATEWARATVPVEHRAFADAIEKSPYTPGARLTKERSDALHRALVGGAGRGKKRIEPDLTAYDAGVRAELGYKQEVLGAALTELAKVESSALREVYRAVEGDAQAVWRRRLSFTASDLVRFGRTYRRWRNQLVRVIEADASCHDQLLAVANPQAASDLATDAGNRQLAHATVVGIDPLVLSVESRRIVDGSKIALLHINEQPCVEAHRDDISLGGSFVIEGMSVGLLSREGIGQERPRNELRWKPKHAPGVAVGDRLIVADAGWFAGTAYDRRVSIARPPADEYAAPKPTCTPQSYEQAPQDHRWCCKPHRANEAEFSDQLAERRARGELNPQAWPPVRDADGFEVSPGGLPQGDATDRPSQAAPTDLTLDDVE
ncbi:hypothetical protein [Microbacterium flavum]|uniref:Uncharacterized protein n=1 Tax=Microbacterium flavum TaxID=415216 RepID=A0ABS5XWU4_9MICO|nr:hypothetical protein [Microbacterium flavum]MBT8798639.1 hypothetical protein [Microbacterium flavum]